MSAACVRSGKALKRARATGFGWQCHLDLGLLAVLAKKRSAPGYDTTTATPVHVFKKVGAG